MKKIFFTTLLITPLFLQASPTVSDFNNCKELGKSVLDKCFAISPLRNNSKCWKASEKSYKQCYNNIFKSYNKKLDKVKK